VSSKPGAGQAGTKEDIRTGIAFASVNLWNERLDRRNRAANFLVQLMPRADKDTWRAISDLFRLVDEFDLDPATGLFLQNLVKHLDKLGAMDSHFVVQRLQTILPHHAELVAKIAHGLVDSWRDELGDIRTATSGSANELVDLAVTLHRLGGETREAGTELFEKLITANAYGARETLDEIDNRFRGGTRRARPRVPRSTRRRRASNRIMRTRK